MKLEDGRTMSAVDEPDNIDDVQEPYDTTCSRYSPKEVFHTVINPRLLNILDGNFVLFFCNSFIWGQHLSYFSLGSHNNRSHRCHLEEFVV